MRCPIAPQGCRAQSGNRTRVVSLEGRHDATTLIVHSHTEIRTRASEVKAQYTNRLYYVGSVALMRLFRFCLDLSMFLLPMRFPSLLWVYIFVHFAMPYTVYWPRKLDRIEHWLNVLLY